MTTSEVLARAAHADAWQQHGLLRAGRGGAVADLPGIRLMASGLPHPQWNNGDVTDPDVVDVGAVRAWYAPHGVPWGVRVPAGTAWPHGTFLFRKRLFVLPAPPSPPAADAHPHPGPAAPAGTHPAPPSRHPADSHTAPPSRHPADTHSVPERAVPGLTIRAATPDDLATVVAVTAAAFDGDPVLESAWIAPHLDSCRVTVALAELDGRAVATGYVLRSDGRAGPAAYVAGLAVAPDVTTVGVDAAVCAWLVRGAFAGGARLAHVHPDTDEEAATYAGLGFTESGALDIYVDLA